MRAVAIVISFAGILLLAIQLPAVLDGIQDFRTRVASQTFQVVTGASDNNANVVLDSPLWDNAISHITLVASNETEAATANTYNGTTRTLNVNGLTGNITRTITVNYRTPALDDYTGADAFIQHVPTGYVFGLIGIAMAVLGAAFARR